MSNTWRQVSARLRALATYRFALMIGAAFVFTLLAMAMMAVLAFMPWPEGAAEARVNQLGWLVLMMGSGMILTLLALAWGELSSASISLPNGTSLSVDFGDEDEPEREERPRRRYRKGGADDARY